MLAGGAEIGSVAAEHLGDAGEAQRLDVAADRAAGDGVLLHEQAVGGPARQRLQPQRPAAGEQVEHARLSDREVGDAVLQDVEQCLAHAVRRGARVAALRCGERAAAEMSGDDPHGSVLRRQ